MTQDKKGLSSTFALDQLTGKRTRIGGRDWSQVSKVQTPMQKGPKPCPHPHTIPIPDAYLYCRCIMCGQLGFIGKVAGRPTYKLWQTRPPWWPEAKKSIEDGYKRACHYFDDKPELKKSQVGTRIAIKDEEVSTND